MSSMLPSDDAKWPGLSARASMMNCRNSSQSCGRSVTASRRRSSGVFILSRRGCVASIVAAKLQKISLRAAEALFFSWCVAIL